MLINSNPQLANTLLLRSEEIKNFNNWTDEERVNFLFSVLEKISEHVLSSNDPHEEIEEGEIRSLGNFYRSFSDALNAYSRDTYTAILGWDREHGSTYQYFENHGNNNVFVSFYSEGHPKKEFKKKFDFLTYSFSEELDRLWLLPVNKTKSITSITKFFSL